MSTRVTATGRKERVADDRFAEPTCIYGYARALARLYLKAPHVFSSLLFSSLQFVSLSFFSSFHRVSLFSSLFPLYRVVSGVCHLVVLGRSLCSLLVSTPRPRRSSPRRYFSPYRVGETRDNFRWPTSTLSRSRCVSRATSRKNIPLALTRPPVYLLAPIYSFPSLLLSPPRIFLFASVLLSPVALRVPALDHQALYRPFCDLFIGNKRQVSRAPRGKQDTLGFERAASPSTFRFLSIRPIVSVDFPSEFHDCSILYGFSATWKRLWVSAIW